MTKLRNDIARPAEGYREESSRFAIVTMIVAATLVGTPLALANKKIEDNGSHAADVSKYALLAKKLDGTVVAVRDILKNGVVRDSVLSGGNILAAKGSKVITPPIAPTNLNESTLNPNNVDLDLSAIYWNEREPLATINDKNYKVGDKVKGTGFTILEIRETEVLFRSPTGEKVLKSIYEYPAAK